MFNELPFETWSYINDPFRLKITIQLAFRLDPSYTLVTALNENIAVQYQSPVRTIKRSVARGRLLKRTIN